MNLLVNTILVPTLIMFTFIANFCAGGPKSNVYNIDKKDFREIVQRLTSKESASSSQKVSNRKERLTSLIPTSTFSNFPASKLSLGQNEHLKQNIGIDHNNADQQINNQLNTVATAANRYIQPTADVIDSGTNSNPNNRYIQPTTPNMEAIHRDLLYPADNNDSFHIMAASTFGGGLHGLNDQFNNLHEPYYAAYQQQISPFDQTNGTQFAAIHNEQQWFDQVQNDKIESVDQQQQQQQLNMMPLAAEVANHHDAFPNQILTSQEADIPYPALANMGQAANQEDSGHKQQELLSQYLTYQNLHPYHHNPMPLDQSQFDQQYYFVDQNQLLQTEQINVAQPIAEEKGLFDQDQFFQTLTDPRTVANENHADQGQINPHLVDKNFFEGIVPSFSHLADQNQQQIITFNQQFQPSLDQYNSLPSSTDQSNDQLQLEHFKQTKNDKMKRQINADHSKEANKFIGGNMEKKAKSIPILAEAGASDSDLEEKEENFAKQILHIVGLSLLALDISPTSINGTLELIMLGDTAIENVHYQIVDKVFGNNLRQMIAINVIEQIKVALLGDDQIKGNNLYMEMIGEIDDQIETVFGQSLLKLKNEANQTQFDKNYFMKTKVLFFYRRLYRKLLGFLTAPYDGNIANQLKALPKKSPREALILWLTAAMKNVFREYLTFSNKNNDIKDRQKDTYLSLLEFDEIENCKEQMNLAFFAAQMTAAPLMGEQISEWQPNQLNIIEMITRISTQNMACLIMRKPKLDLKQIIKLSNSMTGSRISYARAFKQMFVMTLQQLMAKYDGQNELIVIRNAKIYVHFYDAILNGIVTQCTLAFLSASLSNAFSWHTIKDFLTKSIDQMNALISDWEQHSTSERMKRQKQFLLDLYAKHCNGITAKLLA